MVGCPRISNLEFPISAEQFVAEMGDSERSSLISEIGHHPEIAMAAAHSSFSDIHLEKWFLFPAFDPFQCASNQKIIQNVPGFCSQIEAIVEVLESSLAVGNCY